MRILVVEDERDLNNIIVKKLTAEGYGTDSCFDGEAALDYIEGTEYDAIILDIMLPKMDGLEVVRHLRAQGNKAPVLFLTARDSISDRVIGLDSGADDYLVKPFSFDELMARVRVMMRKRTGSVSNVFTVGDLTVDCNTHIVKRKKSVITLSPKEFALLEYLIRNKGIVLSREKIENHIWNFDYEGTSNVVDVYIRYLRKKIDDECPNKLIHTIRGSGYVLREEI
ncbi:response regulator transcription factor [Clostridium formicaceticum]|uniref:Stage 0 sporulation protein A homolog n=1 Tax=Clostridium formicaceticum TaxID=1497 RepID=A0AAC9RQ83_9CLOT|nr:response regulator transcription factor [Clostridium formicaceticum]AOY77731.1 DNA-binding response regulator [Clostridium formicaceticum]ARE88325.1 Response regulator MprA [Clostridium formicaceticum]